MKVFPSVTFSKNIIHKLYLPFALFLALVLFSPLAITKAQDAAAPAAAPAAGDDALADKGKTVFEQNCKSCHAINEQVVGPALKDAPKRWPSEAALINFIKYPQKTIEGGDAYAKGLYAKFNQFMPNQDALGEDNIKAVIAYIKKESAAPAPAAAKAETTASADGAATAKGGIDDGTINLLIAGLIVVLVLLFGVLLLLITVITNFLKSKTDLTAEDRDFIEQKTDWNGILNSSVFKGAVAFIFVLVISKVTFDKTYAVGINQGYAPTQPIPFSHKLHAGMYEIDCNYCHTGVNKGKSATIPSANICLNCHNQIKTESPSIKILWDKVKNNEPIQWVRVHNLPDLAYFNHAQHVKVGGVECETCHGAIKEMEVVEQHSTLTMGWCINCHRETVVKAEGNAYYDKLVKMHNVKSTDPMKVVNIGGLECSKCHY
jgi:cytochrome c551/c552